MAGMMGGRKPSAAEEKSEGEGPRDFMSALDNAPEEVSEGEADGEPPLDAEQLDLAKTMGLDKEEATALRRFIRSCC